MDVPTRTSSPTALAEVKKMELSSPPVDKISAYYSLVFPHFTFYVQTLSVTIGRRCAPNPHASSSFTFESLNVDVDLGALKSVSRLHAKIEYDHDEDRFVLAVVGRNGAWVDGIWCGSGSRAPLGDRSQIQIASRSFCFVLPPAVRDNVGTPSSQSSCSRVRSPSVDITSISPPSSQHSHSPPPAVGRKPSVPSLDPQPVSYSCRRKPPLTSPNRLSTSNSKEKARKLTTSKKRPKYDGETAVLPKLKPVDMPPKPPFTYAQLIYLAIKATGGKATLQEICSWIMNTHDYYQYADSSWMSSVRHNLSSSRAFMKLERCGGDRGKGFFWKLDGIHSRALEVQEANNWQTGTSTATVTAEGNGKRKKEKFQVKLDSPLKRSVKGDLVGAPLRPPLTSVPLPMKSSAMKSFSVADGARSAIQTAASTGVFSYQQQARVTKPTVPSASSGNGPLQSMNTLGVNSSSTLHSPGNRSDRTLPPAISKSSFSSYSLPAADSTSTCQITPLVSNVNLPIILGPIPLSHPDYSPSHPHNSTKEGYMILHERTLILDPDVFGGLPKDTLLELEKVGTIAALQVLKEHMIKVLKERRVKGRGKGGKKTKRIEKHDDLVDLESVSKEPYMNSSAQDPRAKAIIFGDAVVESIGCNSQLGVAFASDSVDEGFATKRRKLNCTP